VPPAEEETTLTRARLVPQLLACALATSACGKAQTRPAPGPPEVATVTVHAERTVLSTELPGRTAPYLMAEVRPQVNGIIQQRPFVEGSDVAAGSLLYQIDPAPYQAARDQAQAALAMAEADLPAARTRVERLAQLVEISAVGQQDFDDASAALQQALARAASARAALESARINLSYTPIRAPIPGRTGRSSVTVGALVTAYQPVPLVVIQQLDPIYVDVMQSSSDVLRLRRSLATGGLARNGSSWNRVKLLLEDGQAYVREGQLGFRDVTVDPGSGSVSLRMVFPNPDHLLLPGMFVRAVVEEGMREHAILVPQQAVSRDARGAAVALVVGEGGKVEQRRLELDRAIGDRWLIGQGLAEGDQVIVEGLQRVRAGATVKAVPFVAAPGQEPGAGPAVAAVK
jgi:membrane fusion protein (multidrug efflux system)